LDIRNNTAASIILTADSCRSTYHINADADAIDYTLPDAAPGLGSVFYDDAGGVITVDPQDGDYIRLNDTDLAAGNAIDSPGAKGNYIMLIALDYDHWVTLGRSGVWVDGGAD
jgi:hypothetical protein